LKKTSHDSPKLPVCDQPEPIAAQGRSCQIHVILGSVLAKLGKSDEALEHFRTAVALDPNDAQASLYLAQALKLKAK
jgi:Flp pilus assembly protein TadD